MACWQWLLYTPDMTNSDPNPYAPPQPLVDLASELSTFVPVVQGSGQLSWGDFKAGQRLSRSWPWGINTALGGVLILFGVLMLGSSGAVKWHNYYFVVFGVVMAILAFRSFRLMRLWYRLWAHPMGLSALQSIAVSPDGLLIKNAHSIVLLSWRKIQRFRVNSRVLLLFYQPHGHWQVFPRSYFNTDNEWHAFVDIVQANVPQG